jgi:hypothetical protein
MAVLVVVALRPTDARAQGAPAGPSRPWEAAVVTGAFLGHPDETAERGYDEWYGTPQVALVAGRHMTNNLKWQVELSVSGDGGQFIQEPIAVPNSPYPIFVSSDRHTRVSAVQTSVVYQFFDNQWAHPFVHIGVAAGSERVRARRWPQQLRLGPNDLIVTAEDVHTTTHQVGLVVGTGAKLYITPRFFVRADTQVASFSLATHLTFRAGLGVDF